jgi:outer membrane protein
LLRTAETAFEESTTETERFVLPETPLPLDEMEALTSAARSARRMTLMQAVCRAMEANQSLKVEKLRPEISNTSIESAEGEFDTRLSASFSAGTRHSPSLPARDKDPDPAVVRIETESISRSNDASLDLSGRLPTGTNYSIGITGGRSTTNRTLPLYDGSANLNITQNLLNGAGCEVNLANVRIAQNSFVISLYQLQQTVINLIADTQNAYWDLYLAIETLKIRVKAYEVAKEQRLRTREFVKVGRVPPLDYLSAQAEESARISDVISAVADVRRRHVLFLRLLNPQYERKKWNTLIFPAQEPVVPSEALVPEERVKLARFYRPDLRQAQLDLANRELDVIQSENGLLPVLDFTVSAGTSGIGDTYDQAFDEVQHKKYPNWNVGLQFSYPLQNRSARASYRRANFSQQQSEEAIKNYEELIEVDVRTAIIEVERTRKLIDSTEVTRKLREEELASEIQKFSVGRSTQLLVATAQRDLTTAQLAEISSVIANIKSYIQLYKVEGTTLQRNGITPIYITPASGVDRH